MVRARMQQLGLGLLVFGALSACGEDSNSPVTPVNQPVRWWSFSKYKVGTSGEVPFGTEKVQVGGTVQETVEFGGMVLFPQLAGPIAKADVFSNEAGTTYWASAQAPSAVLGPGATIGSVAELQQYQVFSKQDSNATLSLVVSKAFFEAIDVNGGVPSAIECPEMPPGGNPDLSCLHVMESWVEYEVFASLDNGKTLMKTGGIAVLRGFGGDWRFDAYTSGGSSARLWGFFDFGFEQDVEESGAGEHAVAFLTSPITIRVPLDSVPIGGTILLFAHVKASALNHRQRESYLSSYFRDPVTPDGLAFSYAGLDPFETPAVKPAEPAPLTAPECSGGTGAGTLQFQASGFSVSEASGPGGIVVVTRTGGTTGAVSATVTLGGGSASEGSDYSAVSTTVFFADGDDGARFVRVPILGDNTEEPDETVTLTLSAPKGCASLGSQSSTLLTIQDDDHPITPPVSFTVGGTVSGLVGTGLLLTNLGSTVTPGNGPFVFPTEYSDGIPYDVRVTTQPTNPDQVCTVTHGSGDISGADVTDVAVACVTQQTNGDLDPTYGSAGKVTIGLLGGATDMVIQTDGKAIVMGERRMARYNTDGTLDQSFGASGNVTIPFNGGMFDAAFGLTLQPDGKIVVVGSTQVGSQDDFAVARYTMAGQLDGTFGNGGNVHLDFNGQVDRAYAALIRSDGSIVVAGHAARPIVSGIDNDFAVARFTSTGSVDSTFGTNGKVTTNIGGRTDLAFSAALQSDDKILVGGRVADGGGDDPDVGIVRYNSDGSPDNNFGTQGILRRDLTGNWDEVSGLVIQSDGRILAAVQGVVGTTFDFMVARFETGGSLDQSFGNQGVASTGFGTQNDFAKALVLQSDGKIVVAGNQTTANMDFGVARFLTTGVLDSSFGTDGRVSVDFFGSSDGANAVGVQSDGKILAAGTASNGTQAGLGLVRILP